MYKNLEAEMVRKNVTKALIAKHLGIRYATVLDKMNGKSRFYYDEALNIKNEYFKKLDLEYLFQIIGVNN